MKNITSDALDTSLSYLPTETNLIFDADTGTPSDVLKKYASILTDNIITQYIEQQADKICADAGISAEDLIYASDSLKWRVHNSITTINQIFANKTDAVNQMNAEIYARLQHLYETQLGILDHRIETFIDYNSKPFKPLKPARQYPNTYILSDIDRLSVAKNLAEAFLNLKAYTIKIAERTVGIDQATLNDEMRIINGIIRDKLSAIMNNSNPVSDEISEEFDDIQQNMNDYDNKVNRMLDKWYSSGVDELRST